MLLFIFAEDCDNSNVTSEDNGDSISCPLCQEKFDRQSEMECHAMSVHSVNQEGLQRLQSLINGSHWLNQTSKQRSKSREEMEEDEEDRRRQSTSDDQGKNNKTTNFLFHFVLKYYNSKRAFI